MTLSAGARLGPYEILSPLGAGGMGEVYRARDTRLDRDVAVKVLPESLANDRDALSRFEREAKAVAALNHPNILSLHDFGKEGNVAYAVMELLEGENLRQKLEGGAIPRRRAVETAIQIAKGLAAAHEKGIVHRDLKPENLFLTKDGRVKILDFGLAKVVLRQAAQTSAPTTPAGTEPGTVMGTVGYMSPEQVLGREVDERTDIFSFGAVLFEMLTGSRAFKGNSAVETMNAILKEEPPEPEQTAKRISPALDRIVRHCLEKSPEARFHSAGDLAFALESAAETSSSGAVAAGTSVPSRRRLLPIAPVVAVALVIAAIVLLAGRALWRRPETTWTGTLLGGPEIAMEPRISPDGHTLAFQAMVNDMTQVAVMKPESGNWQVLTHKGGGGYVSSIAWSADGNRIFFDRTADVPMGIYSVPVLGGDEQLVLEDAEAPVPLPDGTLLVVKTNAQRALQLFRFWPDSGRLRELPLIFENTFWVPLAVFPDGREAVAFARSTEPGLGSKSPHIYAVNPDSGALRRIETGLPDDSTTALAPAPDNVSLLVALPAGDLTRVVRVPRKGGRASTPLLTLTESIHELDCAADGSVYVEALNFRRIISGLPPGGGRATRIVAAPAGLFLESLGSLRDGRVVLGQSSAGRNRLVVLQPGKDPANLVMTGEETTPPVTRVGSGEVAFLLGGEPRRTIGVSSLASGRIERRIAFDKGPIVSLDASPDGRTLYCGAGGSIWAISLAGSGPRDAQGQPRRICAGESAAADPDGKSLLVQVLEVPRARLLRVPLDGGAPREIALNGPFHLTFDSLNSAELSGDGRLLAPLASLDDWYFVPGMIDLSTGRMTRIPTDSLGDVHGMAWAPDGQVVVEANELRSAIWRFTPEGK